jgi:hypothetical protein
MMMDNRPTKPPHHWRWIAVICAGPPWTMTDFIAFISY